MLEGTTTGTGVVTSGMLDAVIDGTGISVADPDTPTEAVAEPSTGPTLTDALPEIVTPGMGTEVEAEADGSDVVELGTTSLELGNAVSVDADEDEVDTATSVEGSKMVVIDVLGIAVLAASVLLAGGVDVESAVGTELVVEVVVLLGEDVGSAVVLVVEPAVGTSVVMTGLVVALDVVDGGADDVSVEEAGTEDVVVLVLVAGSLTLEDRVADVLVGAETLDVGDVGAALDVVALDVDDVVAGSEVVAADEVIEAAVEDELTAGTELVAADECVAVDVTTPGDDGNKLATDELAATEDAMSDDDEEAVWDAPWPGWVDTLCAGT